MPRRKISRIEGGTPARYVNGSQAPAYAWLPIPFTLPIAMGAV